MGAGMNFRRFSLDSNHCDKQQIAGGRYTLPMQMHVPMNHGLPGIERHTGNPVMPIQSYFGQSTQSDMRLLRPKEEAIDDSSFRNPLSSQHTPSSSLYQQIMGRLQMGP